MLSFLKSPLSISPWARYSDSPSYCPARAHRGSILGEVYPTIDDAYRPNISPSSVSDDIHRLIPDFEFHPLEPLAIPAQMEPNQTWRPPSVPRGRRIRLSNIASAGDRDICHERYPGVLQLRRWPAIRQCMDQRRHGVAFGNDCSRAAARGDSLADGSEYRDPPLRTTSASVSISRPPLRPVAPAAQRLRTTASPIGPPTWSADDASDEDPPPPYVFDDRNPFFRSVCAQPELIAMDGDIEESIEGQVTELSRRNALCATTSSRRLSLARHEGTREMVKKVIKGIIECADNIVRSAGDMPKAVKDARKEQRVRRAKTKIIWLENHNFIIAQDRLLSSELRG